MSAPDSQLSFDDLDATHDLLLHEVTFVVLDLETTGTKPGEDAITEIAATKIRGGNVLGEFATLVDPERGIPPSVVAITGITDLMVSEAPRLPAVLPGFLEFIRGSVLVAHNAAFDTGFLRTVCERHQQPWPKPPVVCTLKLARRVLTREETPNHKLGTLARVLRARTTPNHRALDDVRATIDVLHALLERVGSLGVRTLRDLLDHLPAISPRQRAQRHLADGLPDAPGVYLFRGPNEEVLYVGTAGNLRRRVRNYFTAGETRARIKEMVALARRIDHVICAHPLEAEVRELRLIAAHAPPYNRRSKFPRRAWWVVLTDEPFPRLSIVRRPRPTALGPFRSRQAATTAVEALHAATTLRKCTDRLSARSPSGKPCVFHELGSCAAPCAGWQSTQEYAPQVVAVDELVTGGSDEVLEQLHAQLDRLASEERFETAAARRDQLVSLINAVDSGQRLAALAAISELVAARPDGNGGWQLAVVRHGRLASAGNAARGVSPMPVVDELTAAAETVVADTDPLRGASPDEIRVLHRWLTNDGTRLVHSSQPWSEPATSAGRWRAWARQAVLGRDPYSGADSTAR